jgi:hypothetical protein
VFCEKFFNWYNNDHYHSGLALMTPACVHYGFAEELNELRLDVLERAFTEHPERFVGGRPKGLKLPTEAWINPPKITEQNKSFAATTSNGTIIR